MAARSGDICERTFDFAIRVVRFCMKLDSRPGVSRTVGNQLLRAGCSIGANVEEAQAAQSRPDFLHRYGIALKEARETNYWLRLIGAAEVSTEPAVNELLGESRELGRILGAIIVSTKRGSSR
jgi:four helix bundle protein